jgi:hypothetical protein
MIAPAALKHLMCLILRIPEFSLSAVPDHPAVDLGVLKSSRRSLPPPAHRSERDPVSA